MLVGEVTAPQLKLEELLFRANNDLAVLARESARQAVELREANVARAKTEWTLNGSGKSSRSA